MDSENPNYEALETALQTQNVDETEKALAQIPEGKVGVWALLIAMRQNLVTLLLLLKHSPPTEEKMYLLTETIRNNYFDAFRAILRHTTTDECLFPDYIMAMSRRTGLSPRECLNSFPASDQIRFNYETVLAAVATYARTDMLALLLTDWITIAHCDSANVHCFVSDGFKSGKIVCENKWMKFIALLLDKGYSAPKFAYFLADAITAGYNNLVELLAKPMLPLDPDDEDIETLLVQKAVATNNVTALHCLIQQMSKDDHEIYDNGLSDAVVDTSMENAIDVIVKQGNATIISWFLEHGGSVTDLAEHLVTFIADNRVATVKCLWDHGIRWKHYKKMRHAPLKKAAIKGNLQLLEWLSPHLKEDHAATDIVFWTAFEHGRTQVLEWMWQQEMTPHQNNLCTPEKGHKKVLEICEKHRAVKVLEWLQSHELEVDCGFNNLCLRIALSAKNYAFINWALRHKKPLPRGDVEVVRSAVAAGVIDKLITAGLKPTTELVWGHWEKHAKRQVLLLYLSARAAGVALPSLPTIMWHKINSYWTV